MRVKLPVSPTALSGNQINELESYLCDGSMGNAEILNTDHNLLLTSLTKIVKTHLGYSLDSLNVMNNPALQIVTRSVLNETYAKLRDRQDIGKSIKSRLDRLTQEKFIQNNSERDKNKWKRLSILSGWTGKKWAKEIRTIVTEAMSKEDLAFPIMFLNKTPYYSRQLAKAIAVLDAVVPRLASHTISLMEGFAVVKAPFTSAYNNEAPQMFIINEPELDDVLTFADTLIHEALHEKMALIRVTHHLLRSGYDDFESERKGHLRLPWPNCESNPRFFSVARGLATYHYYVHSAFLMATVFSSNVPLLNQYDKESILFRFDRSFGRAQFIRDAFTEQDCIDELGEDGTSFLMWMDSVLLSLENHFVGNRKITSAWK